MCYAITLWEFILFCNWAWEMVHVIEVDGTREKRNLHNTHILCINNNYTKDKSAHIFINIVLTPTSQTFFTYFALWAIFVVAAIRRCCHFIVFSVIVLISRHLRIFVWDLLLFVVHFIISVYRIKGDNGVVTKTRFYMLCPAVMIVWYCRWTGGELLTITKLSCYNGNKWIVIMTQLNIIHTSMPGPTRFDDIFTLHTTRIWTLTPHSWSWTSASATMWLGRS